MASSATIVFICSFDGGDNGHRIKLYRNVTTWTFIGTLQNMLLLCKCSKNAISKANKNNRNTDDSHHQDKTKWVPIIKKKSKLKSSISTTNTIEKPMI